MAEPSRLEITTSPILSYLKLLNINQIPSLYPARSTKPPRRLFGSPPYILQRNSSTLLLRPSPLPKHRLSKSKNPSYYYRFIGFTMQISDVFLTVYVKVSKNCSNEFFLHKSAIARLLTYDLVCCASVFLLCTKIISLLTILFSWWGLPNFR